MVELTTQAKASEQSSLNEETIKQQVNMIKRFFIRVFEGSINELIPLIFRYNYNEAKHIKRFNESQLDLTEKKAELHRHIAENCGRISSEMETSWAELKEAQKYLNRTIKLHNQRYAFLRNKTAEGISNFDVIEIHGFYQEEIIKKLNTDSEFEGWNIYADTSNPDSISSIYFWKAA